MAGRLITPSSPTSEHEQQQQQPQSTDDSITRIAAKLGSSSSGSGSASVAVSAAGPQTHHGHTHSSSTPMLGPVGVSSGTRKKIAVFFFTASLVLLILFFVTISYSVRDSKNATSSRSSYVYSNGAVAADEPTCSNMGASILNQGGSAVDATVTTALCLGVINSFASGLGGGGYMLVYGLDNNVAEVIDFREQAPMSSTPDMYYNNTAASFTGGKAIGIPGELAGLFYAQSKYGKLPWSQVVAPALQLAINGFPATKLLRARLLQVNFSDPITSTLKQIYSKSGLVSGPLVDVGDIVTRPKLAYTLDTISKSNITDFYSGSLAQIFVNDINAAGGNVTLADFQAYRVISRKPLVSSYRNYQLLSVPPSSSGGTVLSIVMNILERFDFSSLGSNSEGFTDVQVQILVEALKFAYAQRYSLGDPDFINGLDTIVNSLITKETARFMSLNISSARTYPPSYYGPLYSNVVDHGTSHISVMTKTQAVSMTTTVNTLFGSKLASPITGIIYNNQMNDFSVSDKPNAFGLAPSAANTVRPKKRPLSSTTPSLLLSPSNQPYQVICIGGSGGPTIISSVAQVLLQLIHHGKSPVDAVSLPRLHHQHLPNEVDVDPNYPDSLVQALRARGHVVSLMTGQLADGTGLGNIQVVVYDGQQFSAASDPRKNGQPAGF